MERVYVNLRILATLSHSKSKLIWQSPGVIPTELSREQLSAIIHFFGVGHRSFPDTYVNKLNKENFLY